MASSFVRQLLTLSMILLVANSSVGLAQGAGNGGPTRLVFLPANDGMLDERRHVELRIFANDDVVGVLCSNISCDEEKVLGKTKLAHLMDRVKKGSRLSHVTINAAGRLPSVIAYISAMIIVGNAAVSNSAADRPLGAFGFIVAAGVCFQGFVDTIVQIRVNAQCFTNLRDEINGLQNLPQGNLAMKHARGDLSLLTSLVSSLF